MSSDALTAPHRPAVRHSVVAGVNLVLAALAMTATLPGRTFGLGLITAPLETDLGIGGPTLGLMNFWAVLIGSASCLPVGWLMDRVGVRATLTSVCAGLGGAVLWMSAVGDPYSLMIALTLVRGLGQGALSVVSLAMVGLWFTRRRGPAMGVFSLLMTVGLTAAALAVTQAVADHGWRPAWAGVGVGVLALAGLSLLFARTPPLSDAKEEQSGDAAGFTLREALWTPAFWVYTVGMSLFGLMFSGLTFFNEAVLTDHGFDPRTAGLVIAVLTFSGMASNLLGGWLTTRGSMAAVLAPGMLLFAGSLAWFPSVATPTDVMIYAVVLGFAGGLITVVFFAFYGHAYGRRRLGRIQGAAQVLTVFASALGPWLLAECKTRMGTYDPMFYGVAGVVALLGIMTLLTPLPRRDAAAPEAGA
jgi:MFS family permease